MSLFWILMLSYVAGGLLSVIVAAAYVNACHKAGRDISAYIDKGDEGLALGFSGIFWPLLVVVLLGTVLLYRPIHKVMVNRLTKPPLTEERPTVICDACRKELSDGEYR